MRTWLRDLRLSKGYTQKQCAELLEIEQGYYSDIENFNKLKDGLPMPFANKLCKIFKITFNYIQKHEMEVLENE